MTVIEMIRTVLCPGDILQDDWYLDLILDDINEPEPGATIDSYGRSLRE